MAKTVKGLLLHAVDLLTASIGWIDMVDAQKAKHHIRESIGVLMEAESRLEVLLTDLEGNLSELDDAFLNRPASLQERVSDAQSRVSAMQKSLNTTADEDKKKAEEKK
jgi:hypothetical protein